MQNTKFYLSFLFSIISYGAVAQNATVYGQVTDEKGETIDWNDLENMEIMLSLLVSDYSVSIDNGFLTENHDYGDCFTALTVGGSGVFRSDMNFLRGLSDYK